MMESISDFLNLDVSDLIIIIFIIIFVIAYIIIETRENAKKKLGK